MATADHVSEEQENYVRLDLLLTDISSRAVRVLFDNEFHPPCLNDSIKKGKDTLDDLKKKKRINKEQWNLLFPSGGDPQSTSFDVTLMIMLLRNLATLAPPTGGYENLPLSTDIRLTADLARIKFYRNKLSHDKTAKIKTAFFSSTWKLISEAVTRLGGQNMGKECEELRVKRLDHSTVPWNIREPISKELEQWRSNAVNFVETSAAKQVLECIQENSSVTITASSGVGKTATLRHVALKMADEKYDVLLVDNPQDIVKFYNPNKKTLFVIDDFCGTYSINQSDLLNWEPVMKRIKALLQNKLTKIIVACRLQVYNDEKFNSLSIFRKKVCNLSSVDFRLSLTERQLIAEIYLETEGSQIIQYSDKFDCFPLLCKLYHDNTSTLNIIDFFQSPFSVFENEVEQLRTNGLFEKYCALALCVMFNNELEEEVLADDIDIEPETEAIIKNTFKACRLVEGTPRLKIKDQLDAFENTFIKKDQGVYKTIHTKLFDFLSYYFGKKMIQCLIKNAHCKFIRERFSFEIEENIMNMDHFLINVPPKYHKIYLKRMVDDWSNDQIIHVFFNKNMNNPTFRQRYLCYLNTFDILYQQQLARKCDINYGDTVLLQCCFTGDVPLVQWCCKHRDVEVNKCRSDGATPLCVATQRGDTEVVNILLNNEAEINKRSNENTSALFIACQKNHVGIVKLLLDKEADIDQCKDNGPSPLFIACYKNRVEIVKLLLDKKADINKCTDDETSPLFIACSEGNKDIAKLLLDKKANVDKCTKDTTSPLFVACQKNHVDIVKLLLENKANINNCRDTGSSPLFIACYKNRVDVVKLLLESKADINKCTDNETSPLFIACQKNHVMIVKLLLDNKLKANIDKCTYSGSSPLFIACQEGHLDIVELLVDHNADINKCTHDVTSPLFIACQENKVDIVELLLDNKTDVNQCTDEGMSPLYIACAKNHVDVAKLLINKKAEINRCSNTETSPLYIACDRNYVDIVKLLLINKANINKCNDEGTSPLGIACLEGYKDIVELLLNEKAEINKCNNSEISPLYFACQNNHLEIINMLLDKNAEIDKCMDNGASPLLIACQQNHLNTVKLLLDKDVDIDKCTYDGTSPLFIACERNHVDIVQILLEKKADINKCIDNGISPLFIACRRNHVDIVKMLLNNKADIDKCTDTGASPLFIACQEGHVDIVKMLLDKKADINKCAAYETSPVFIACQQGHGHIVKLLLKNKADINKCMADAADAISPLFIAFQNNHEDIVKLLLDNKADIN